MRRRTFRRAVWILVAVAAVAAGAWLAIARWPRPSGVAQPSTAPTTARPAEAAEARKIRATLFYLSADGLRLVAVEREVPYGEGPVEQGRRIVEEVLKPPPAPYASPVPAGTQLRDLFITPRGDAFVDLSREISAAHPGGSLTELFTVYAIVNTLTVNLPAVTAVQLLVDGQEVDTLAGHIDLRRPLRKNLRWAGAPEAP